MTFHTKLVPVLFLAASLAYPKRELELCGTHSLRAAEELALHRRATPQRAAKARARMATGAAGRVSVARDIGNIAILEDADGVVERRNPFNLEQRLLRFRRTAAGLYRYENFAGGYRAELAAAGEKIDGLGDDDTRAFALPFAFPFYGKTYTRLHVNSDGNLTFDAGDVATSDRSLGRLNAGAPRMAAFFEDLDPSRGGDVRVTSQSGLFAVSWVTVPEFSDAGTGPRNTFQLVLSPDGTIEFSYQTVGTRSAVVGIAPGGLQGNAAVVSFSGAGAPAGDFGGTVAERFSNTDEVDMVFAAQKFYETHDDVYDYLVVYNTLGIPAGAQAVAFEVTVRSDRLGIGDRVTDDGASYGSRRRLQAVLNLGPTSQYPVNPNAVVPARATARDTPLTVLGHEAGHLWVAFASVRDAADPSARPMLGRQTAHWAFPFNSEASLLEGNRIQDNGPGVFPRFRTVATVEGYAPLDQYLMGLRGPEEVPPTFLVTSPTVGPVNRSPQVGVSFDGQRRDITIEEVVAAEGPRKPDHTVSQRRFRFAFVLITAAGREPSSAELAQVEGYRTGFEPFFARVTGDRASADTTLLRNLDLSLAPAGGVLAGATATASVSLQRPAEADLTVLLRTSAGAASVPASVTIRAGSTRAEFAVRGERVGVEELTAEPADTRFAAAHARVPVAAGVSALRLVAASGGAQVVAAPSTALAEPVVVRAVDGNNIPYAGQAVTATVSSGTVSPARALTDENGFARFVWTPGAGPLYELAAALEGGGAAAGVTITALGKPFIATGGVVNSASFAAGISPGGLATIFGASLAGGVTDRATRLPLPDTLGGVRVTVDGQAAQLLYVSDRQINLLAPALASTAATAEVAVSWGGETVRSSVPLRLADPGLFVLDAAARTGAVLVSGTGQTTEARPAAAGETIEIYATGLGPVRPSSAFPGLAETTASASVSIGGRDAVVLFSGLTPGFQGLYQVNARVPAGLAAGRQPVTVRMAGGAGPSNEVFIRVR